MSIAQVFSAEHSLIPRSRCHSARHTTQLRSRSYTSPLPRRRRMTPHRFIARLPLCTTCARRPAHPHDVTSSRRTARRQTHNIVINLDASCSCSGDREHALRNVSCSILRVDALHLLPTNYIRECASLSNRHLHAPSPAASCTVASAPLCQTTVGDCNRNSWRSQWVPCQMQRRACRFRLATHKLPEPSTSAGGW